jgi:hypothetical protein
LGQGAFASVVRPQDLHRIFLERSGRRARLPVGLEGRVERDQPMAAQSCAS